MSVNWTSDLDDKIRRLRPTMSYDRMAVVMGISKNALIGRARRIGMATGPSVIRQASLDDPRIEDAKRLLKEGFTIKQIAARLKMDKARVTRVRNEMGLFVVRPKRAEKKTSTTEKRPAVKVQPPIIRGKFQCLFLKGDEKPWEPCTERAIHGRPYCLAHQDLCTPTWRREAA